MTDDTIITTSPAIITPADRAFAIKLLDKGGNWAALLSFRGRSPDAAARMMRGIERAQAMLEKGIALNATKARAIAKALIDAGRFCRANEGEDAAEKLAEAERIAALLRA